jgi:hypothetical protein
MTALKEALGCTNTALPAKFNSGKSAALSL